jgi:hypothetical protein
MNENALPDQALSGLIRIRFQRSKIEGAFAVRKVPPSPLQETLTLAGASFRNEK